MVLENAAATPLAREFFNPSANAEDEPPSPFPPPRETVKWTCVFETFRLSAGVRRSGSLTLFRRRRDNPFRLTMGRVDAPNVVDGRRNKMIT
mmetsp:Transcript_32773/g.40265  ORF Transcript_32773/g.40265 Transcript_32773/m.40265 type:complete len:92 (-) Transcript_32773:149-424(-)|eukprot:CAMPEP_0172484894 /NCGR_PEP_ID=MMETSP1066-20121228/12568_1 /TAXON_ID=671091 /ORGANISM="Coscinodiscus wailesii, Strain CCMP2513" /LENGTH=91 /DNA_ID=CAMNT_0013249715 /DNA_START=1144 /DNA_END=1419 /DNA_ORIENTATION=+